MFFIVDPPSVKQSSQGEPTAKGVTEAAVWDAWVSCFFKFFNFVLFFPHLDSSISGMLSHRLSSENFIVSCEDTDRILCCRRAANLFQALRLYVISYPDLPRSVRTVSTSEILVRD